MADYKDAPLAEQPQAFKSVLGSPVEYSGPAEAIRSVGQGLTFGTLDEIEAALRTGSISGPEYEKQRNLLREQQKQFGMDVPIVKNKCRNWRKFDCSSRCCQASGKTCSCC